ncbi:MAG: hypothetical protein JST12_13475 [Armatimonadetes bacterium]|nr:hypothetical protein [Armatimonadota bacterium]
MYKIVSVGCIFTIALALCGCSGGDDSKTSTSVEIGGMKVKTSGDSKDAKVTYEGDNGEKVTLDASNNGSVTIQDKDRKMTAGQSEVTEADLGVPLYPSSTLSEIGDTKMEVPEEKGAISLRYTSDEPSKVVEFYKPKLTEAKEMGSGDTMMLTGKVGDKGSFSMTLTKQNGKTLIRIGTQFKK